MVYDATKPANNEKIRNLGVAIRPNWQAIEEADATFKPYAINLANRTPLIVPNDPAAIANTFILYCKEDASGFPELWGIDKDSNKTQISVSVPAVSAAAGYTWLAGGMLMQWTHTGAIASGADSVQMFPITFSAAPYSVVITGRHNGGEVVSGNIHTLLLDRFTLRNTSASARDFYWIAIGPKV